MATHQEEGAPPSKRRKLDANERSKVATIEEPTFTTRGINRPISPPLSRRKSPVPPASFKPTWNFDEIPKQATGSTTSDTSPDIETKKKGYKGTKFVPSPIRLTRIEDLGPHRNVDSVGLTEILGDPMIKECWNFNFLFDLDFVM